jgi:hypothetical protein
MYIRIFLSLMVSLLLIQPLLAQPPFLQNRWAKAAIAQNDYPKAVLHSVESLKYWPGNSKATANLKTAYAPMTGDFEEKRSQLGQLTDTLVGDETVTYCQKLVSLYDSTIAAVEAIGGMSDADKQAIGFAAVDYRADRDLAEQHLGEIQQEASQMHSTQGEWLMEQGTMETCRSAYHEYTLALDYAPGNEDLHQRRDAARECGTKRVLVMPFSVSSSGTSLSALQRQPVNLGQEAANAFSQRIGRQDLIFIEMIPVDEVIAEMSSQGQNQATPLAQEAILQIGQTLEADEIWMGTVNSVIAENLTTQTTRGLELKTTVKRKEKVIKEIIVDGKATTGYEEVEKSKAVTATYDQHNQTTATVVKGTYWTFDVASGERSEAKPYEERQTYAATWANYTGGSKEAWAKFSGSTQSTMPALSTRLLGGFQAIGTSLSSSFQAENKRMALPVIHSKMELKSGLTD